MKILLKKSISDYQTLIENYEKSLQSQQLRDKSSNRSSESKRKANSTLANFAEKPSVSPFGKEKFQRAEARNTNPNSSLSSLVPRQKKEQPLPQVVGGG